MSETVSLRAAELQTLIDVTPVGIAIAHDPTCRRITANAAFVQMVESRLDGALLEPGTARAPSVSAFLRDGREIPVRKFPLMRAAAEAVDVRGEEIDVRHENGSVVTLYGFASPVFDAAGGVAGCIGAFVDVTERKRAESEAEEHRRELAHLGRVAVLGELSGALAHDLRQPLAAILTNVKAAERLLTSNQADLPDVGQDLADISDDVRRATDVIQNTRSLMKKGPLHHVPIHMNEVVRSALDLMHGELTARRVVVAARLSPSLPEVLGDRAQRQQVLLNLLMNACDAMMTVAPGDRHLVISTSVTGGEVQLSVVDNGSGVADGNMDRLFQPFYTSKQQGLGLGLSICRSIVTSHGGRLWAVNNSNRGATFYMAIPLAPGDEQVTAGSRSVDIPHRSAIA